MSDTTPTLHMLCGKIASGKSTLAAMLAQTDRAVLLAEDDWLAALYSDVFSSPADYVRCAARLRAAMGPHIADLLNAGASVVLDFPANTLETRSWMRGVLARTNAAHQLHILDTPDALCLDRLAQRNADGDHPFATTEAQFYMFSRHYTAPSPDEGFNVVIHSGIA